ncbi:hypothetical protein OG241_28070 [Streptomyces sp. NBC_01390]|uniref:hypothetical protein n=1 Tax=Streptomyces sp. NBC_01390 TaxID=2903850 RepID=UPI00324DDF71
MAEMEGKNEKNGKKRRIPLAHVALILCSVALVRFLTDVIFDFSVDSLIDGLVGLVLQVGVTTALVMAVVLFRRRKQRQQRGAEG